MSTQFEASAAPAPTTDAPSATDAAVAAVRDRFEALNDIDGIDYTDAVVRVALAAYEQHRRPEWSEVMIEDLERKRDIAREERDRARATAVRLEQELAEARR